MSMQQLMLGYGAKQKTYMDDVFSTYVYTGTGSAQSINNGIDLAGEGGMTWIKGRSVGTSHIINDTVRGAGNRIYSNSDDESSSGTAFLSAFNSNGFSIGNDNDVSYDDQTFSSWSFRKAKGFFDCVTWTGNSDTNQTISHSLKSIPGMIIAKRTDSSTTGDWVVYHRDYEGYLKLNSSNGGASSSDWQDITSTSFRAYDYINVNGASYVAYVFAGGESTAATANSASFAADVCYTDSSSNYTLGTSDFTLEYWYKADSNPSSGNSSYIVDYADNDWATRVQPDGTHQYMVGDTARITSTTPLGEGQWHHIAIVRSSGTSRMYINGVQEGGTYSDSTDYSFTQFYMGRRENGTNPLYGKISNLRLVVGTAVYTSSFRPPTEPLTNITNTKLLCLNSSSVTGTTVGTIQISGNTDLSPTASTDSPFDDPAAFTFGDSGDQGIIKCGSYVGNDSSDGPKINLGWEPSLLMIKRASGGTGDWRMFDSMRGLSGNGVTDSFLEANTTDTEVSNLNCVDISSTGFELKSSDTNWNALNDDYIYLAIRRPDGYVGKPAEAGTDVFTMDVGNSTNNSYTPSFDSTFYPDFGMLKHKNIAEDWHVSARLIDKKYLKTNSNAAEASADYVRFDLENGWATGWASTHIGYMWKRHAGFDVVTYTGNDGSGSSSQAVPHSLSKTPEMIWVKCRNTAKDWRVYHKGLDGGTSPEDKSLVLNSSAAEVDSVNIWNDTAPTSTHFTLFNNGDVNDTGNTYIAMLFASVDGISKCGYYDGSENAQTITVGFQPRFILIKRTTSGAGGDDWVVADTLRGIGAGSNDKILYLNDNAAQSTQSLIDITSTGFTVVADYQEVNHEDHKYIYYAHA